MLTAFTPGVPDNSAELRLKAEACRKLSGMFEEPEREALWIECAGHWETTRDRG